MNLPFATGTFDMHGSKPIMFAYKPALWYLRTPIHSFRSSLKGLPQEKRFRGIQGSVTY